MHPICLQACIVQFNHRCKTIVRRVIHIYENPIRSWAFPKSELVRRITGQPGSGEAEAVAIRAPVRRLRFTGPDGNEAASMHLCDDGVRDRAISAQYFNRSRLVRWSTSDRSFQHYVIAAIRLYVNPPCGPTAIRTFLGWLRRR